MSEIVELVCAGTSGRKPTLRIRCSTCGRVYVATCDLAQARRVVRCQHCRTFNGWPGVAPHRKRHIVREFSRHKIGFT